MTLGRLVLRLAIATIGIVSAGGQRVLAQGSVCPESTARNALAIWYLQWDVPPLPDIGCSASGAYMNAYGGLFDEYEAHGEWWDDTANYTLVTETPAITMYFANTQMAGKSVVLFDTHGGGAGTSTPGAPVLEYHPNLTSALDAAANYLQIGTYGPNEITTQSSSFGSTWQGVGPTSLGIRQKFRVNHQKALILGFWSNSDETRDDWGRAAFIGHFDSPDCNLSQDGTVTILNRLACKAPGGNTVQASTLNLSMAMTWAGAGGWALSCNVGCDNGVARFHAAGAFGDEVWGLFDHRNSKSIRILGFKSRDDWPQRGTVLREINPLPDGGHAYVEKGLAGHGFPYFCWVEEDISGKLSWSEPFAVTKRPENWDELMRYGNEVVEEQQRVPEGEPSFREVWFGKNGEVLNSPQAAKSGDEDERVAANPYPGTDVALLGMNTGDGGRVATELANLQAIDPTWTVRTFYNSPYTTVAVQQQIATDIRQNNIAYNNWCTAHPGECTRTYPETPVIGLIGSPLGASAEVEYATFPDSYDHCGHVAVGPCIDAGAGANIIVGSSPLEDLPIYLIPASTQSEVANLKTSAARYEDPTNPSRVHTRAIFLVGDRYNGGMQPLPEMSLQNLESACEAQGIPAYSLRASGYPAGVYAPRKTDFVAAVNAGTSLIAGWGGSTTKVQWPGDFTYGLNWEAELTTPQTMVALLPSCNTAAEQTSFWSSTSTIKRGLFASPSGTTLAFALGHMRGGYDHQHGLWMEIIGLAYADAAVGTPWPRIIFDAKYRAVAQYPFLEDYLRSALSVGTMVRKQPQPTTSDVGPDDATTGLPESLGLRVVGTESGWPTFEFSLPRADDASLTVYDARGRLVATIYSQRADAGRLRVTWNGRDKHGEVVRSGVYFAKLLTRVNGVATTKTVIVR